VAMRARTKAARWWHTVGAPLDVGGGAVDAQNNEGRLPDAVLRAPHVSVTVLAAGDDAVGLGGPVDAGDDLVVLQRRQRRRQAGGGARGGLPRPLCARSPSRRPPS
jgi:hypothetical protein